MAATDIISALDLFARTNNTALPPQWDAEVPAGNLSDCPLALEEVRKHLDWGRSVEISGRPQPEDFPLLIHEPEAGWAVAYQWVGDDELAIVGRRAPMAWNETLTFFRPSIPDPLGQEKSRPSAFLRGRLRNAGGCWLSPVSRPFLRTS